MLLAVESVCVVEVTERKRDNFCGAEDDIIYEGATGKKKKAPFNGGGGITVFLLGITMKHKAIFDWVDVF